MIEKYLGHTNYLHVDQFQTKNGRWIHRYIDCKTGKWFRVQDGKIVG